MAGHEILLHIAGGVALLLWSTRMVRTGLLRAFGTELRKVISRSTRSLPGAALAGFGVTTALQSSTATTMLAVSFAGRGMIALAPALALMLGADLGSTMVVQFLSFDLYWLSPALLLLGVLLFLTAQAPLRRQLGRVLVGLGLMLLALDLTVGATDQLRSSAALESILASLADEAVVAVLLGALLAWLFHSSVALTIYEKSKTFTVEAGKIILAISIVLWIAASFGPGDKIKNAEQYVSEQVNREEIGEMAFEAKVDAFKLENSFAGLFGKFLEPVIRPLGYDWKIGIALVTSFAAREVFVGTMATIYSIGSEDESTIKSRMAAEINPRTGGPMYTPAVAFSLMIFYAFAMQCMSTLAIVKKETNSWKWPLLQLGFMTGVAYIFSWVVYTIFS